MHTNIFWEMLYVNSFLFFTRVVQKLLFAITANIGSVCSRKKRDPTNKNIQ